MQDNIDAVGGGLSNMLSLALLIGSLWVWGRIIRRKYRRQPLVAYEPRYPVPWSGLDVALLAAAMLFCEIAAAGIVGRITGDVSAGITPEKLLGATVARLAWMAIAIVYLAAKCGAYADDLGFDLTRLWHDARLGGVAFLAALVPVFAVQAFFVFVLDIPSEHPLLKLTQDQPGVAILALATLVAVGVAPLFEEFAFRVLLQGWLESQQAQLRERLGGDGEGRPGFTPIVITSLLFAVLHLGHGPDPFALFVLALILGYVYRQTHRIGPSLVVHACLNGWTMLNLWILFLSSGPAA